MELLKKYNLKHKYKDNSLIYAFIAVILAIPPFFLRVLLPDKPNLADDAYYYLVVAQNIAESGSSSFYTGVLTNGYHPLWLGLLTAGSAIADHAILKATVSLGIVLCALTIFVVLKYLRPKTVLGTLNIAILTYIPFQLSSAFSGMESGLVLFFGTWACLAMIVPQRYDVRSLALGTTLLVMATASRLDFAVFAILLFLFSPGFPIWHRFIAFLVYGAFGAVYAVVNLAIFGSALPISGAIKSLGGMQFNERFAHQLAINPITPKTIVLNLAHLSFSAILFGMTILSFISLAVFLRANLKKTENRGALVLAFVSVVGTGLYFSKILFFSSWQVWPWYKYPSAILLLSGIVVFSQAIAAGTPEAIKKTTVVLLAITLVVFYGVANDEIKSRHSFKKLNQEFVDLNRNRLKNKKILMGDRAGSLAYYINNKKVFQMEGLVMGSEYFQQLKKGGDLTPYFCSKGIDIVLDYEPDLGNYDRHKIQALRPTLTQYDGGYITVYENDQIFKFQNLDVFKPTKKDSDGIIYGWKMHCKNHSSKNN